MFHIPCIVQLSPGQGTLLDNWTFVDVRFTLLFKHHQISTWQRWLRNYNVEGTWFAATTSVSSLHGDGNLQCAAFMTRTLATTTLNSNSWHHSRLLLSAGTGLCKVITYDQVHSNCSAIPRLRALSAPYPSPKAMHSRTRCQR